jgi:hypothetical protein
MMLASSVFLLALALAADHRWTTPEGFEQVLPDYLVPDDCPYGGFNPLYEEAIANALLGEHGRRTCGILLASVNEPAWAVYLVADAASDGSRVIVKQLDEDASLDAAYLCGPIEQVARADALPQVLEVRTRLATTALRWEARIGPATAERVGRVWTELLASVRHPSYAPSVGCGSPSYHLSHSSEELGDRRGRAIDPQPGMVLHELLLLVQELREVAVSGPSCRPAKVLAVERRASAILDRLAAERR